MKILCDLHLHSCVSPHADMTLSPSKLVKTLKEKRIHLAALTDMNTALNCPAFYLLCKREHIVPLVGMEAQTAEEVRVLVLFANLRLAVAFAQEWYRYLPEIPNDPMENGDQFYVDENGAVLGTVEKHLNTSASVSIFELERQVHKLGGLVVPSHVDATTFSMVNQFGSIAEGNWDALEFQNIDNAPFLLTKPYPCITASDALYPQHVGRRCMELDIGNKPLLYHDGTVNLEAIRAGFARRVIQNVR